MFILFKKKIANFFCSQLPGSPRPDTSYLYDQPDFVYDDNQMDTGIERRGCTRLLLTFLTVIDDDNRAR